MRNSSMGRTSSGFGETGYWGRVLSCLIEHVRCQWAEFRPLCGAPPSDASGSYAAASEPLSPRSASQSLGVQEQWNW
jgi:hypothetical protein